MWKLLIVEDEPLVRKTIVQKVNWNEHGFEIIGEAENGCDALDMIIDQQPDLVISDIVMPVMDGVELLKRARAGSWTGRFLMLTCMNEFEYARQALEHGASGYILKLSMDMKALEAALVKVKRELIARKEVESTLHTSRYGQLLHSLWNSFYMETEEEALGSHPLVEIPAGLGEYVWMCSFVHHSPEFCLNEVKRLALFTASNQLMLMPFTASGITTVFAWGIRSIDWQTTDLGSTQLTYPAVVTVAQGANGLGDEWFQALCCLDDYWHEGRKGVFLSNRASRLKRNETSLPWALEKELLRYVEQNKAEQCRLNVERMWQAMRDISYPASKVYETILRLDSTIARIVNHPGQSIQDLRLSSSSHAFMQLFIGRLLKYMNYRDAYEEGMTDHDEINKILRFIHQNYETNLSLKSLSKYVAMEEHYISRLFKLKTGENLIIYVHKYRVDKAKIYLKETDMSVSEVGWSVGFANDNYFIKIFKRYSGTTPNAYRQDN